MAKKAAKRKTEDVASVDVIDLAKRIKRDRLNRRMSWPDYAAFRNIGQSTIYKIADGRTTRPHETTVADIVAWLPSWSELEASAAAK